MVTLKLRFNTITAARAFYSLRRSSPDETIAGCIRTTRYRDHIKVVGVRFSSGDIIRFARPL